jgi:hypothetical protein
MATPIVVCKVCNKPLKAATAIGNVCGARCSKLATAGVTGTVIASAKQTYAISSIPAGFITIAQLHVLIANNPQNGATVSKMVQATGGDRPYLNLSVKGVGKFANPITVPLIQAGSKTRMVHGWLATTAGMQAIATGAYTGAPKPHPLQVAIFSKAK